MFFKNTFRPAMAGASAAADTKWSRKLSSMMFSNSTAESADFGAFSDEPERPAAPKRNGNGGKKGGFKLDTKAIVIVAVAAVLVIALIIGGLVALFTSGVINFSGNIMYEDNAYMVYVDGQDNYRIIANGELLEETFDGELTLIPADDNSFAYVFHDGEDGIYMYILKGKKLEVANDSAVDGYVAVAGLKPGIVFTETSSSGSINYMLYNDNGVDIVAKEIDKPDSFVISDDGKTVVYTLADDDTGERVPYMFEDSPEQIEKTGTPVAVSYHGDYVYFKKTVKVNDVDTVKLFVRDMKKGETYPVNNSEGFLSILEMNKKGDELIFCTGKGPDSASDLLSGIITGIFNGNITGELVDVTSYLYRHKASDEESTMELGPDFVTSAKIDPEVAIYKTFAGKYLQTTALSEDTEYRYTYRLTNRFEKQNISKYSGKFDAKGEYLYCINKDGDLIQYDVNDSSKYKTIYRDVKDFEITEKGNVYLIDDGNYLVYYKVAPKAKKPRISSEAIEMSFCTGANKLYFAENEAAVVYTTEEGGSKDAAKFGSTELTTLPYFSTEKDGKCYAVVFDETKESYSVYYSKNGNSFKYLKDVTDCADITYGITIPEAIEW